MAQAFGIEDVEKIKLIYKGKLLKNDAFTSEYNLKQDDKINLVVLKTSQQIEQEIYTQEQEEQISTIIEIGNCSRETAISSLKVTNWNPDLALTYIEVIDL